MAAVPHIGRATRVERPVAPGADAAGDLYERYSAQIYGYCLHQLGSREEAEDAVQTTFMNAFRGLQRGIVPEMESAWLFKIAHNVCLSRRRSSWRRGKVEAPNNFEVLQEVVPGREQVAADELIRLQDVLEEMPESQRRAILLREWQGLTYREVADELGVSQAAVETLIFRARRALAAGLEQDADTWKKRLRRGADAGGAVACIKALLSGGGAATVKIAATALAVATVGAAAITAPAHRHSSAHRTQAARTAPKAHAAASHVSKRAFSGAANDSVVSRKSSIPAPAANRRLSRPVALPASKPEETTNAPVASAPASAPSEAAQTASAPPTPAADEPAPTPPPARNEEPATAGPADHGNATEEKKDDQLDRHPQSTLAPPTETTPPPPPADPQQAPEPPAPPPNHANTPDPQDNGTSDKPNAANGNGHGHGKSDK